MELVFEGYSLPKGKNMKEELLHYVWRTKRFQFENLKTTEGESVQILQFGSYNSDAGPDFFNARIQIGDTFWAGNVEMHLKTSDWLKHKHHQDQAYDNVILHVVLEEDEILFRKSKSRIPCLELKNRIEPSLVKKYKKLNRNKYWIPCQEQLHAVADIHRNLWLDNLLVERLIHKTALIDIVLKETKNDWEGVFYRFLARNFGLKVNAQPFEDLARLVPLLLLLKHKNRLLQIEALFFGQAGLLEEDFDDLYPRQLKKEYAFLREKYALQALSKNTWKFLRLRPANFPTIRIAQLATLIYQTNSLFGKVLAAANVKEIENMFAVKLSNYWQEHYRFDKLSAKRKKTLGKSTIHLFIINTIAPFLFLYGQRKSEEKYKEKALQLLQELRPENNQIIQKWKQLGVEPESAYQTQALLHLKQQYCSKFRCLNCAIGHRILSKKE